jgi:enediyne biosynthesis protein E4
LLFSCNNKEKTARPFEAMTLDFENIPISNDKLGILYFINYYNGSGVAAGDINNDGLTDLYFAANDRGKNKLFLNKGNFQFEDITAKAGVEGMADWCTGVTMADVNADGYLDIYVCSVNKKHGLTGRNALYINNGASGSAGGGGITFTESAEQYGLAFSGYSTQAAFFDYDHDGDLDCFLLNQSDHAHEYIVDTSSRRRFDANAGDYLFRNELNTGVKRFTDVSKQAGISQSFIGFGLGLAVADINNDGWEDIYVGNDFHENDYYYVNNGDGTFTDKGATAFSHYSRFSMGNDVADYDNDGNLDVLTVDMLPPDEKVLKTYGSDERVDVYNYKITGNGYQPQFSRNCLQRNNGAGQSFSDIGLAAGIAATDWSWSALMPDLDNDGNKDIFISSGIVKRTADLDYVRFVSELRNQKTYNTSPNLDSKAIDKMPDGKSFCFAFKGDGKGDFTNESEAWGFKDHVGYYTGAAYADLDNDGDLDLIVSPIDSKAMIYKNNSPVKNFLQLKFRGDSLNTSGIGTKTYVYQNGKMQYQQLMLTRGFQSSSWNVLHFGLDSIANIDSVLIIWPDAKFQLIKQPKANQLLTVQKKDATGKYVYADSDHSKDLLIEFPGNKKIWRHREDPIKDFNEQYLIPHALSIRGPKIAVADVNRDGLEDFFVCGALGQAGALFTQGKNSELIRWDSAAFALDSMCEDVDAVFFDANGDSFPDLYVASGGNVYKNNNPNLADRLYINDGKGHFNKSTDKLPIIALNKSTVSAADVDGDKDIDLFVGVLADPDAYGKPQTSYLLINDGTGKFSVADKSVIELENIGMVTASAWADMNADGKPDLIIAGEWMPVTIFINSQGKFTKQEIASTSGLWQSVFINDVNGDGSLDILAGNWGLNCKLAAGKTGPLKLYVGDFDKNGKSDPILAYTIDGKEYPFLPKDEIEVVLPMVKKKFLYYKDYAGKTVQEVFDVDDKNVLKLHADDLSSTLFLNDGKGNFRNIKLPMEFQLAPLFAFTRIYGSDIFLAGGNFYGVLPYEGQYDASALLYFTIDKSKSGAELINSSHVIENKGQTRDLKWIGGTWGSKQKLIVARNNGSLLFYLPNSNFKATK